MPRGVHNGKRGRKPKPTSLLILEGKLPADAVEIVADLPPAKMHSVAADMIASAEWDRVMAAMPPKIYCALDSTALAEYSLAWSMLVRAQTEIEVGGITITVYAVDDNGERYVAAVKTNPAVRIWKVAADTLRAASDRLGLNPINRARLNLPTKADTAKSAFAGLMGRTEAAR